MSSLPLLRGPIAQIALARSEHRVRLARASHSIGKAGSIVAELDLGEERLDGLFEDDGVGQLVAENLMEGELAVAGARMVVHQVAVIHAEQVLILRPKRLNDRVALASVRRNMGLLLRKKRTNPDADFEFGGQRRC